jgi:hypothetical protein
LSQSPLALMFPRKLRRLVADINAALIQGVLDMTQ